jgi:hypothetical protein
MTYLAMLICVNKRYPFRCYQGRTKLEMAEIDSDEDEIILVCPRCSWPTLIFQGIPVLDDRALPDSVRRRFYQKCSELGLPTPVELRKTSRVRMIAG